MFEIWSYREHGSFGNFIGSISDEETAQEVARLRPQTIVFFAGLEVES